MTTESEKSRVSNASDWMSKGDAARARGVSRQAIWELVSRGRLTTTVIAGRVLVSRAEVMGFAPRPRGLGMKNRPKGKAYVKKKNYDPSKWISLIEAARTVGVTRQVIADLIRRRRLRTLVSADKTFVQRSGLENFMSQRRKPVPSRRTKKK